MFTLNDILQGNKGKLEMVCAQQPDPDLTFHAAHHDSRQIGPGDLFLAIKGAKVDGHTFITKAAQAGAKAALCEHPVPASDVPADFIQFVVPNVVEALHNTARMRTRRQPETTYIGITGSNGKTSTKEAIATILSKVAPTLKTAASYNTEIGFPITLLNLESHHRYAVLEMGAQWVGELAMLSTITRPDWSVITNVGASHLGYFGSQEQVTIAKSELVQVLEPDGIAILNYDDLRVRGMQEKTRARVLFYGTDEAADVRATDIGGDALFGLHFTLHYRGEQVPVQLRLPGEHGVTIALAAAAVGCAAQIPLSTIAEALEELTAFKRRGELKPGPNGSTIVDDSYNANRQSIIAIARAMKEAKQVSGKRWAVLGDILELGEYSRDEHYQTGEALAGLVDYIVAIGDHARYFIEGANAAGLPAEQTWYYSANLENTPELEAAKRATADLLKSQVQASDLVLLKGSLGVGLDSLLRMLSE
uniref:UDP-N-acetylmuramoyl-tripeptide--D-alanyl-D-alanine ligase n=1 Tax=Thermosporothrix sp. COM3 TaxID=2490863 RepID=A0A455SLI1_9CHLR|nr:UDP-N-acetylmuramoyl-tripeptide--D-alanyl-D-alanine ligase [Thermosporothrix sp. COM3]